MATTYTRTVRTVRYGPGGEKTVITNTTTDGDGMNGPSYGGSRYTGGRRYSRGWTPAAPIKKPTGPPMKLAGKTYEEIKSQCLSEGRLFEDPDFPAINTSVFFSCAPPQPFEWKRPTELSQAPQFISDGATRFDVKQGALGDCWLLAAVASLCQYQRLLCKVVPQDQNFKDGYCGLFRFNFWQYGKWVEVVVDDRLPSYQGQLVMMHSEDKNEFWTSLLEKAYAKLCGSYESLKGGSSSEAMEDFTGGVTEMFELQGKTPPNLFKIMLKAYERESMMGCSIDADPRVTEARLTNGLVRGHAYSITGVKLIDIKTSRTSGKIPLIRIRNPWGNECEWKGAWSDQSPEWKFISDQDRKEIGLTFDHDGEFWMSFQDFSQNFQKLEICNLSADSLTDEELASEKKRRWECLTHDGSWIKRVNAGGCRNYLQTFWTNPQYRFDVIDPDDDDDENAGTVLLALMQSGRRKKRQEGADLLTIGYGVYKIEGNVASGPLDLRFFQANKSVARPGNGSAPFINLREVCGRHKLEPGQYVVVPSTFEPNEEGEFMLRIFTEKPVTSSEMDEETSIGERDSGKKQPGEPSRPAPTIKPTAEDSEAEKAVKEAFKKIAGVDLEIDAYELQDILNVVYKKEFSFDGFSADTCRSLVAMKDVDRSGKLGYEEFKKLWNDLRIWKTAFKKQDTDKSGNFNSFELRQTLSEIGIRLSNQTFNALVQRYCHKDGKMYFDDYIHCIARLTTMFDVFKEMSNGSKEAGFTMDQFIQTTMYS